MNDADKAARDKALARIRKLLAMADDKRGNANEIAAAGAHAAKLMQRYNIEHAEALAFDIRSGQGIVSADIADPNYDKRIPHWYNVLATTVGRTLDCQCRLLWSNVNGRNQVVFKLFGYKPDIEVAQWLFAYLHGQVQRMAERDWKEALEVYKGLGRTITPPLRRKWKDQYRWGVVNGITSRIEQVYSKTDSTDETKPEQDAPGGLSASDSRALVVLREVKRQAVVDAFPDIEFTYTDNLGARIRKVDTFWKGFASANEVRVERVLTTQDNHELADQGYVRYCDDCRAINVYPLPYAEWQSSLQEANS